MDAATEYKKLKKIAITEFADIIKSAQIRQGPLHTPKKLRLLFINNSFLDIWISKNKYSYHWQVSNTEIYRHDNAPHKKHKNIETYPKHFHKGSQDNVTKSHISEEPEKAIRQILRFVRKNLTK